MIVVCLFFPFSFGHCIYMSFNLQLLMTPLISSNCSYKPNIYVTGQLIVQHCVQDIIIYILLDY